MSDWKTPTGCSVVLGKWLFVYVSEDGAIEAPSLDILQFALEHRLQINLCFFGYKLPKDLLKEIYAACLGHKALSKLCHPQIRQLMIRWAHNELAQITTSPPSPIKEDE